MLSSLVIQTWNTTPIVTKTLTVLLLSTSLAVNLGIVSEFTLSFSTFYIKRLELWRLITPFCYFGKFNIEVLIHIIFFLRYSKMLEEGYIYTSDYLYLVLYNTFVIILLGIFFKFSMLSNILSSAITYIWTRRNRTTQVQLMGCIIFPAFYLPFIVPCFSLFSERRLPFDEVLGLFVGQSYFYLKYVTRRYGFEVLRTPKFLKRLCGEEFKLNEDEKSDYEDRNEESFNDLNDESENREKNEEEVGKEEEIKDVEKNEGDKDEIIDEESYESAEHQIREEQTEKEESAEEKKEEETNSNQLKGGMSQDDWEDWSEQEDGRYDGEIE